MDENKIEIVPVTNNEVLLLQKLSIATFYETFAQYNTPENMLLYEQSSLSVDKLQIELNNTESHFFFLKVNNLIAGYLKLNTGKAQTDLVSNDALEIERIYVLKAFQGQKLGLLLFQKAMALAASWQKTMVWLGVWEHNVKAINFYQKLGFQKFNEHSFTLGTDIQTDWLMKIDC